MGCQYGKVDSQTHNNHNGLASLIQHLDTLQKDMDVNQHAGRLAWHR